MLHRAEIAVLYAFSPWPYVLHDAQIWCSRTPTPGGGGRHGGDLAGWDQRREIISLLLYSEKLPTFHLPSIKLLFDF